MKDFLSCWAAPRASSTPPWRREQKPANPDTGPPAALLKKPEVLPEAYFLPGATARKRRLPVSTRQQRRSSRVSTASGAQSPGGSSRGQASIPPGPKGTLVHVHRERKRAVDVRREINPAALVTEERLRSVSLEIERSISDALRHVDVNWVKDPETGGVRKSGYDHLQLLRVYRVAFARILEEDKGPFVGILERIKEAYEDVLVHRFEDDLSDLRYRLAESEKKAKALEEFRDAAVSRIACARLEAHTAKLRLHRMEEQLVDICAQTGASVKGVAALRRTYSGQTRTLATIRRRQGEIAKDVGIAIDNRRQSPRLRASDGGAPSSFDEAEPESCGPTSVEGVLSNLFAGSTLRGKRDVRKVSAGSDDDSSVVAEPESVVISKSPAVCPSTDAPVSALPGFEATPASVPDRPALLSPASPLAEQPKWCEGDRVGRGYDWLAPKLPDGNRIDTSCELAAEATSSSPTFST